MSKVLCKTNVYSIKGEKERYEKYNGGYVMYPPDELFPSLEMDIVYQCEDGSVFAHNFHNDPIVYTTCQSNGTMIRHGKIDYWPTCVDRKKLVI